MYQKRIEETEEELIKRSRTFIIILKGLILIGIGLIVLFRILH